MILKRKQVKDKNILKRGSIEFLLFIQLHHSLLKPFNIN